MAAFVRIDETLGNGYQCRVEEKAVNHSELTDFPDRLSPVLVKELRQGLRTNLFVTAFILLQGFMILTLIGQEPNASGGNDGGIPYWVLIFIAVLIIQPLRGFSALSSEYNTNTMDLIQLTNLDALRITFGKWCAINAQTLLLLITVIPYLILRYFFGSVNLLLEAKLLLLFSISTGVLSAITVGCSAFKHFLTRIVLMVGFCALFYTFFFFLLFEHPTSFLEWVAIGVTAIIIGLYFLLFGASRIAPLSENHSTRKRLLALLGATAIVGFYFLKLDIGVICGTGMLLVGLAVLDAITEELPIFHGVLPPFKSNFLKRILAGFLSPGWHTGVFFLFIIAVPFFFTLFQAYKSSGDPITDFISVCLLTISIILFPFILIHLFFRRSSMSKLILYLFIQCCVAGVTFLAMLVSESVSGASKEMVHLLLPLPSVLLFGYDHIQDNTYILAASAWFAITLVTILIATRGPFREMKEYYKS